jgi:hypothetical protein
MWLGRSELGTKGHQASGRAPDLVAAAMHMETPHLPSLGRSTRKTSPISSWFAGSLGWKLRVTWIFMYRK